MWDPRTRRAAAPRDRLAGPPHGGALRRAARRRATSRSCARAPASCSIRTSRPPRSSGCSSNVEGLRERAQSGRRGVRDGRLVADLQADRRARRPTRRNASRTMLFDIAAGALGRRAARAVRDARAGAARAWPTSCGPIGDDAARGAARPRGAGGGRRRRPAGGAVRPGVRRPGAGQEHLRHRLVRAARTPATRCRRRRRGPARDGRLGDRRAAAYALEASIFVTGAAVQWLRDGLGIIERAAETEALARLAGVATTACTSSPR